MPRLRVTVAGPFGGKRFGAAAVRHLGDEPFGRAARDEEVAVLGSVILLGARLLVRAGLLCVPGFLDLVLPIVLAWALDSVSQANRSANAPVT